MMEGKYLLVFKVCSFFQVQLLGIATLSLMGLNHLLDP